MALTDVEIPVEFGAGLVTAADPKRVPVAYVLALENAVFTRTTALSKRFGYESLGFVVLGQVAPYVNVRGIGVRGDELILFNDDSSFSFVEGSTAWSEIGGVSSVEQSDRIIAKTISAQTAGDYAACSGVAIAAWEDSRGGVWWCVLEDNEGRVIRAPAQASATGSRPRCVRSGDRLHVLWAEAAGGQVKIIVIDPATPDQLDAVQFPRVLVDDLVVAVPNFDAAYAPATGDNTRAASCLAWNANGGVRVGWVDPSGVIGTPSTGWPSPINTVSPTAVVAGPVVAPYALVGDLWAVAWSVSLDVYVIVVDSDATQPNDPCFAFLGLTALSSAATVSAQTMLAISSRYDLADAATVDGMRIDVWMEERRSPVRTSTIRHLVVNALTGAITVPTPLDFPGLSIAGGAFVDPVQVQTIQSHSYVVCVHQAPLFGVYLVLRDDGVCVARTLPGSAADAPTVAHSPRAFADDDRSVRWPAGFKTKLPSSNNDTFTENGIRLVSLDFDAQGSHQTAYLGRTLYLGAACPLLYDGLAWAESGFHYAPDWDVGENLHTNSTAGGGHMTNGTRAYIFWFEATLNNGEIMRGPTSKPYPVTISGSDDRVTLSIPTLDTTAFGLAREECRVIAARTVDGDATLYYRITSPDPSTAGQPNGYLANVRGAGSVTLFDELADNDPDPTIESLVTHEPAYTTGGVLSNDPIPGTLVIAEAAGRLFVGDPSDASGVYHSQERADGYTAEFAPELRIVAPPAGGSITAVGTLDDVKVLFKRSAIYGVTGAGPLPDGTSGWSPVGLITSDVGCIDQRTIVATPVGLMFKSAKGIYLLGRDRQVAFIGDKIKGYDDRTVTRATLVEDTQQVRFLTSDTVCLLYDYRVGEWSTFLNHGGYDSATVDGVYHYLRTDGRVFRQTSTYDDAGLQIPTVIETAWIHFYQTVQGFQRIRHAQVIGTWKSPHKLRVQWMTDYDVDGNWSEPVEFDATDMDGTNYGDGNYGDGPYGGSGPTPYQFTAHVGAKCQSIRFRFSFFEAAGVTGSCAELTELLITGGVKGKKYKLPADRTK